MKYYIAIVLSLALLLTLANPSYATEKERLSDMTESECIEFIKLYGITIPNDYDEATWGPFVKKIIETVERDPDCEFAINYSASLSFANSIKAAVNDYYGVSSSYTIHTRTDNAVMLAEVTLEHSEAIGVWTEIYSHYNCYVFAIGLPEYPKYAFRDPGYFSNQTFSLMYTLSAIADLVEDDLLNLQHSRIHTSTELDLSNLCKNEQVICLRRGQFDYHFMKFTANDWLHKPGSSALLRYLHTPSNSLSWTNEGLFERGYLPGDTVYNSEIIYISYDGHDWDYTYNSDGTHTKSCGICGDSFTHSCDYDYSYAGNGTHTASCADCGHTISGECSSFITTSNGNGTHVISCEDCGHGTSETCRLEYTNLTNTRHSVSCTECDYYIASQACQLNYRAKDGKTHTVSCAKCENRRTQNCGAVIAYTGSGQHSITCHLCEYDKTENCSLVHTYCGDGSQSHTHNTACSVCGNQSQTGTACTFVYRSHGDNTHSYLCSLCDYVKIDHAACLFNANNICRTCGAPKNGAVINKQEEITPE